MEATRFAKWSLLLVVILTVSLQAGIHPLTIFTNNGAYNDSLDIDMFVDVNDPGSNQVDFTVHNENLVSSSIAAVYFDDGGLLGIASIINGSGTSFSQYATPHNLPAGGMLVPPFETTNGFSLDSAPPAPDNGINPGEFVTIRFDIAGGLTVGEIENNLENGDLRIGVHLIALPDGSSESAVTPEPATMMLLGLGGLLLRKRRK